MFKVEEIFKKNHIGLWSIEYYEDQKPKMYVDKVMLENLGIEDLLNPEEIYEFWHDRIDKSCITLVQESIQSIVKTGLGEVEYPWYHPKLGLVYVRCGGNCEHRDGYLLLEGYHRIIDDLIDTNNFLGSKYKIFDKLLYNRYSSYFMDTYDEMIEININTHKMNWVFRLEDKYSFSDNNTDFFNTVDKYIHVDDQPILKEKYIDFINSSENRFNLVFRNLTSLNTYRHVKATFVKDFVRFPNKILMGVYDVEFEKEKESLIKDKEVILEAISKDNIFIYDVDFDNNLVKLFEDNQDKIDYLSFERFTELIEHNSQKYVDSEKIVKFLNIDNLHHILNNDFHSQLDIHLKKASLSEGWSRISAFTSAKFKNHLLVSVNKIDHNDLLTAVIYQYMNTNFESIFYIDYTEDVIRQFMINDNESNNLLGNRELPFSSSIESFIKNHIVESDHNKFREVMANVYDICKSNGSYLMNVGTYDMQGEFKEKSLTFSIFDDRLKILLVLVNDITASFLKKVEEKKNLEQLRRKATIDELTGIYNRSHGIKLISEYISDEGKGQLAALLLIDLDNFKSLNDQFGHQKGDEALMTVGSIISDHFRKTDVVARIGGDEFVVLIKSIRDEGVVDILVPKLIDRLRLSYDQAGKTININASVGVAMIPRDGNDIKTLLSKADKALYQIKRSGKDGYCTYLEEE